MIVEVIFFFLQILFPFRLLHNIEQSSFCYTVGPCWLSSLNIAVHTSQFQPPGVSDALWRLSSSACRGSLPLCESHLGSCLVTEEHVSRLSHAGFAVQVLPAGCCRWWPVKDRVKEKRKSFLETLSDNMPSFPRELWNVAWRMSNNGLQPRMFVEEQWAPRGQTGWWDGGWENVSEPLGREVETPCPPTPTQLSAMVGTGALREGNCSGPRSKNDFEGSFQHRKRSTCQTLLA